MAGPTVTQGQWGYYISASAGTGTVMILSNQGSLRVCGIAAGGTATSDIVTIFDGNGVQVFGAVGSSAAAANSLAALQLAATIRITDPKVVFSGGTSGQCFIYTPSQNA